MEKEGFWEVDKEGSISADGWYHIDAGQLLERDHKKRLLWPYHLSGKAWVDADRFETAWIEGLKKTNQYSKEIQEEVAFAMAAMRSEIKKIRGCIHTREVLPSIMMR